MLTQISHVGALPGLRCYPCLCPGIAFFNAFNPCFAPANVFSPFLPAAVQSLFSVSLPPDCLDWRIKFFVKEMLKITKTVVRPSPHPTFKAATYSLYMSGHYEGQRLYKHYKHNGRGWHTHTYTQTQTNTVGRWRKGLWWKPLVLPTTVLV